MRNAKLAYCVKYIIYLIIFLLLFALQTTPGLFAVMGIKPVLLIPAAIALAITDGVGVGAAFGAVAGLYCDLSSGSLFGFFGFFIVIICVCSALLTDNLLQKNSKTVLLLGVGGALLAQLAYFYFYYALWRYEDVSIIFWRGILPCALYSGALTPLFFPFFRRLSPWLDRRLKISEE